MNSENIKSKPVLVKFTLAFSDLFFFNFSLFLSVAVISVISNDIYEYIPKSVMGTFFFSHFVLSLACAFWFLVRLRHYSYRKPFWFELKEMLRTIIIFAIISLAFVGFSKWELSRYVWLLTWLFALILIPAFRIITKHVFNVLGLWKKQTIIIGSGRNAEEAYVALQSEEILGFDVVAFYCLSPEDERESLFGKKLIKSEEELWDLVDPENTQIIVAVEFEQHALRDYWLKSFAKHACRSVSVIPTLRGVPLYGTDMSFIFSHEVMILRVNNNLAKLTSRFVKRIFDIFGSLAIMTILSPVLLGILLMVSKDGGKPIYGHERVGLKGRKFKCLKFRSMVTNSKEVLANLLATDSEALAEWNKDFKLKNDPRITKIGGFIRKTSLDELPQLWNVLRGDMSLVGPRPIIEEELERYAGDVDYYLMAKPGMTGLWQVSGRNDVDYDTRVYFDSWYVKNWSLWNDIVILFKTVNVVLRRDGAY